MPELITPQKRIVQILDVFGPLPQDLLQKYLKQNLSVKKAETMLNTMVYRRILSRDEQNFCYSTRVFVPSLMPACMLSVFMEFVKDDSIRVARAVYPLDIIFEAEDKLYQLINFSDRGIYKLNFWKNMHHEKRTIPVFPIILLVGEDEKSIPKDILPEFGIFAFATINGAEIEILLKTFGTLCSEE